MSATLTFSKELYQSVNTYGNYYRYGSFKHKDGNIRKANKCIRFVSKKINYNIGYQKVYVKQFKAIKRKGNRTFYYEKGSGYYYGEKLRAKDFLRELKPV